MTNAHIIAMGVCLALAARTLQATTREGWHQRVTNAHVIAMGVCLALAAGTLQATAREECPQRVTNPMALLLPCVWRLRRERCKRSVTASAPKQDQSGTRRESSATLLRQRWIQEGRSSGKQRKAEFEHVSNLAQKQQVRGQRVRNALN